MEALWFDRRALSSRPSPCSIGFRCSVYVVKQCADTITSGGLARPLRLLPVPRGVNAHQALGSEGLCPIRKAKPILHSVWVGYGLRLAARDNRTALAFRPRQARRSFNAPRNFDQRGDYTTSDASCTAHRCVTSGSWLRRRPGSRSFQISPVRQLTAPSAICRSGGGARFPREAIGAPSVPARPR